MTLISNSSILAPIGPIVSVLGGRVYPPWFVGIVAATGFIIGEILVYNVGRITTNTYEKWYNTIKHFMENNGFPTIVLVTAIPNPLINVSAIVAGSLPHLEIFDSNVYWKLDSIYNLCILRKFHQIINLRNVQPENYIGTVLS